LAEKLKPQTALDIFFAVGVGTGGVMIGLAPSLWAVGYAGHMMAIVGAILVLGAVGGRIAKQ
jgi:hypothetical protein